MTPHLSKLIKAFKFNTRKRIKNSYFSLLFSKSFHQYLRKLTAAKSPLLMCCVTKSGNQMKKFDFHDRKNILLLYLTFFFLKIQKNGQHDHKQLFSTQLQTWNRWKGVLLIILPAFSSIWCVKYFCKSQKKKKKSVRMGNIKHMLIWKIKYCETWSKCLSEIICKIQRIEFTEKWNLM